MITGASCWLVLLVSACGAEKWKFPEERATRLDSKVQFIDPPLQQAQQSQVQADEIPFQEPTDTEGFYNRAGGAGRYPVRVEQSAPYRTDRRGVYNVKRNDFTDGTVDSLQYCKCVSEPECSPQPNSQSACGSGQYLCCYKRPGRYQPNSEIFNEVEDERPLLLPGRESLARPFPSPAHLGGDFGHGHQLGLSGGFRPVLVGPDGPSGVIGPAKKPEVLVGPDGPTGVVGPVKSHNHGVLAGPDGPKDLIHPSESAQRGILVGPGGPTGVIGPAGYGRPVLVGPGGPTGIIGPGRGPRRGVLVGPGGPTGVIGPGYGRPAPGILVGPGGPTGQIGPRYFGK